MNPRTPTQMEPISVVASRFGITPQAIYLWIKCGIIPESSVDRTGRQLQIDSAVFTSLLRQGRLMRKRGRKPAQADFRGFFNEDCHTTCGDGPRTEHRWTHDNCNVLREHPYGPGPVAEVLAELCGELVDPL
jgi:hypothetical protein